VGWTWHVFTWHTQGVSGWQDMQLLQNGAGAEVGIRPNARECFGVNEQDV